jgi:hypothetical protein
MIEKQLRADLAAYGLDMARYTCTVESGGGDPMAAAIFRDAAGREISVNPIWTSDDGTIIQRGRPELA